MNRSDFLSQLKSALENELSPREVKEHIDYYDEYIREEVADGKSEQEVLDMLGDPWAIAKTICMSSEMNGNDYVSDGGDTQEDHEDYRRHGKVHVFGLDTWWKKAGLVVAVFAILSLIFSIVSGVLHLIAPIAVPVLVIMLVVNLFKKDR